MSKKSTLFTIETVSENSSGNQQYSHEIWRYVVSILLFITFQRTAQDINNIQLKFGGMYHLYIQKLFP